MSSTRYSQQASTSQSGPSAGMARSSVPAISTSSASRSSHTGTYPISPSPQSALPSSQSYAARHRFSSNPALSNAPTSFLARTPVSGIPATAGAGAAAGSGSAFVQDLLDRPRDKTRTTMVAASSLAFLFAEMVSYTQGRVSGIGELEKK